MYIVLLTAVGVGGATIFGALLGFIFKDLTRKIADAVLAFADGVMLIASINGLILPSLEFEGKYTLLVTLFGIIAGAFLIFLLESAVPAINKSIESAESSKRNRVLLLTLAIAIHNLPEGIAAGVGFGTGDVSGALSLALGIALQNIPEGMVIIAPMISVGVSPRRAFLYASITGIIEILGTFIGFFAVSLASAFLPFAISLAGGAMLYVISEEIIPETHLGEKKLLVSFAFLFGFCFMLALSFII